MPVEQDLHRQDNDRLFDIFGEFQDKYRAEFEDMAIRNNMAVGNIRIRAIMQFLNAEYVYCLGGQGKFRDEKVRAWLLTCVNQALDVAEDLMINANREEN